MAIIIVPHAVIISNKEVNIYKSLAEVILLEEYLADRLKVVTLSFDLNLFHEAYCISEIVTGNY